MEENVRGYGGNLKIGNLFDWEKIAASKEARRRRLAALPYIEKLQILNQMRERDLALKNARPSNTKRFGRS